MVSLAPPPPRRPIQPGPHALVHPRGLWIPETGEHTIAHIFGDVPVEAFNRGSHSVSKRSQKLAHLLRIKRRAERHRVNKVDKHDRDLAMFRFRDRWGRTDDVADASNPASLPCSNGCEQLAVVANRSDAHPHQVLGREVTENFGINIIRRAAHGSRSAASSSSLVDSTINRYSGRAHGPHVAAPHHALNLLLTLLA